MRLAVGGEDDCRLVPQSSQLDRQGPADVGQAAGLGKRHRFAGGQQDIQGRFPLRVALLPILGRLKRQTPRK